MKVGIELVKPLLGLHWLKEGILIDYQLSRRYYHITVDDDVLLMVMMIVVMIYFTYMINTAVSGNVFLVSMLA